MVVANRLGSNFYEEFLFLSELVTDKKTKKFQGYKNYTKQNLNLAVQAYVERKMNLPNASQFYHVPSHTIYTHARKIKDEIRGVCLDNKTKKTLFLSLESRPKRKYFCHKSKSQL